MKTVLLTGATGFIGQSAVRPLLGKNYTVHAVTSKPADFKSTENLIWHRANLLDANETTELIKSVRPTHLLHFAWYVEPGKVWNAIENLDWLQASLHLARRFAENGGKRLIVSGTCAEYDWTESGLFSEESTVLRPQNLYGASKHALNLALENFARVSDLSYAWGRVFYLFGANESPVRLVSSVINALLKNQAAETSHGNQIRDFLDVEDAAEAFVALLESEVFGAVNVASGVPVSLKEIIFKIAAITGNRDLVKFGAINAAPNEPPQIVADVRRLQSEVGWRPKQSLNDGLAKTVEWWRENIRQRF